MLVSKSIRTAMAALALGAALPVASAEARDYGRGGYERHYDGGRDFNRGQRNWDRRGPRYGYYGDAPRRHRDRTGRNIAIGAAAAIIGLAIISGASQPRHRYDY
jgi:hypothetical protein